MRIDEDGDDCEIKMSGRFVSAWIVIVCLVVTMVDDIFVHCYGMFSTDCDSLV